MSRCHRNRASFHPLVYTGKKVVYVTMSQKQNIISSAHLQRKKENVTETEQDLASVYYVCTMYRETELASFVY